MKDSTVVRKNKLLRSKILSLIKNSKIPLSTSDIARKLKKAWHTIDRNCLKRQIENKILGFRVGKMNLWRTI